MGKIWSDTAARYLVDWSTCPRCDSTRLRNGWCTICGADLAGTIGTELSEASKTAAEALAHRQALIDQLPTISEPVTGALSSRETVSTASLAAAAATATATPENTAAAQQGAYVASPTSANPTAWANPSGPATPLVPRERASSQLSVQSVLAVAGAGLFAVAALVFTRFNPDLTDLVLRNSIVVAITLVFLGAAWGFARAGLQFSAEAVGALGMVFVVLDIVALAEAAPTGLSGWAFAAIGTAVCSAIMVAASALARIRSWAWVGLVGLTLTPIFAGLAFDNEWASTIGFVASGFVALVVHDIARRLGTRFDNSLIVDRTTATIIQFSVVTIALCMLPFLYSSSPVLYWLGAAAILASLAALAALSTRNEAAALWSFLTGSFAIAAATYLALAPRLDDAGWYLALVPAAAAIVVVGLGFIRTTGSISRPVLLAGAWTIALIGAFPAGLVALGQFLVPILHLRPNIDDLYSGVVANPELISPALGLAAMVGVACSAASSVALWMLLRSTPPVAVEGATTESPAAELPAAGSADASDTPATPAPTPRAPIGFAGGALSTGLWSAAIAVLALVGWSEFLRVTQSVIGLVLAVAIALAVMRVPRLAAASALVTAPLLVAAHGLLVLVGIISWADSSITVSVGAAIVAALAVVAYALPQAVRPVHFGIGYAYALVIFTTALDLANVHSIAIPTLTTTLASLFALAVTVTRRLRTPTWYAALLVTAIPFLYGIVAVITERSGWTALSTAVTFALALSIVVSRRPGLTVLLRSAAAAILVPALAVVVICLGAQVIIVSASPFTLPTIAVIVACALPSTALIGSALIRHGLAADHARAVRLWIEVSALVTGGIAVLLALVRAAAGLGTSFLVLLIIGIGAVASAWFARRRYAWWVAGASFTGALWCVWAIAGVDVVEPYLLPPALSAAIIGAILIARGTTTNIGLYATGLACAVIPTLGLLAVYNSSADAVTVPWRTIGLLAGSVLLLLLGWYFLGRAPRSRFARMRVLRVPTLVLAMVAASAGTVQGIRWGLSIDALNVISVDVRMLAVVGVSALSALLATVAGRLLLAGATEGARLSRSRWIFAAPLVYLVAGPMSAIEPTPFAIGALLVLSLAVLGLMLVTVQRSRTRATTLPPVWFIFAVAWCTAVAGWSARELRVEAFSIPLGLALLTAGIIAMRPVPTGNAAALTPAATVTTWPIGFTGSWYLLAPGIAVTLFTSVLSTATDPRTERAILVIALALIAILVGNLRKLGAPFILGIVVLPIENIIVFAVQIGRNISAVHWWITLATAGAVLLVLAVTSERSATGARGGVAARLRDLK